MKQDNGIKPQTIKEKIEFLLTINKTKKEICEALPDCKPTTISWYLSKLKIKNNP